MVERTEKSVLRAYIYLALLGVLGVHRFYLKRPGSGLFIAVLTVTAVAGYSVGTLQDQRDMIYLSYFCIAIVAAILLTDLVMIPGIIEGMNDRGEDRRMSVIAGNLDPSFQATMRQAGSEHTEDRPRKSALPEDFERPWKTQKKQSDVYRPGEE